MKIMHILKHCRSGNGHVNVAVDLACTQADLGHDVMFASSGGFYETLLRTHNVDAAMVPDSGGPLAAGRSAKTVIDLARQFQPDVIHAHMMTSAVYGFAASKLVNAPLLTTMHNSFDKHSGLMRLGSRVVAVSEADRQLLLSRGYPSEKVLAVLNGSNESPREYAEDDVPELAGPCVATLSGLHRRKAVGDVISAFAEVHPSFPNWHLNIIGDGPDRQHLSRMVIDLGLEGSIHFIGSSPNPARLLEQAEIFASASLAEPFGLAVAEARAAGCAIVATAVGGVPEVLDNGRAGQLTSASDPSAMATVFRELMSDKATLEAWRFRARWGAEYFTVQRMTEDYMRVYHTLLS